MESPDEEHAPAPAEVATEATMRRGYPLLSSGCPSLAEALAEGGVAFWTGLLAAAHACWKAKGRCSSCARTFKSPTVGGDYLALLPLVRMNW